MEIKKNVRGKLLPMVWYRFFLLATITCTWPILAGRYQAIPERLESFFFYHEVEHTVNLLPLGVDPQKFIVQRIPSGLKEFSCQLSLLGLLERKIV